MSKLSKFCLSIITTVLIVSASSCGSPSRDNVVEIPSLQVTKSLPTDQPTPSPAPTVTVTELPPTAIRSTPTDAPSQVVITAIKGNLFIRRGPDVAFDPVSALTKGMSAVAIARDPLSRWLEVPIPDQKGKTGWVSIKTAYSSITGNVTDLPSKVPTEWPVPAYLRNCTYHEMIVKPGDTTIPSLRKYPENEVWIYPGSYKVYDVDVPGQPVVLEFQMREGITIDIRKDGNGERRKCP